MIRLLREPLVQFLIGGAMLYAALWLFSPEQLDPEDPYTITVSDAALVTYLQYQDKAFDPASAQEILSGLSKAEKELLIEEFIRDEIMVREATALGLDQNDEVIRQRLIQKMDFIFQGFPEDAVEITEAELTAYFEANKERYEIPAAATFTHIFYSKRTRTLEESMAAAQSQLKTFTAKPAPFEDAGKFGDRFYFLRNYVDRSQRMIEDHFGAEMVGQIFTQASMGVWSGPFVSKYGVHLIFLRNKTPSRTPELTEVTDEVLADIERERRDAARKRAYAARAKAYTIERNTGAED
jgi:hypothetical protein